MSQRDFVLYGRICAHISPQSSSVLVGFVEGFVVEFGSQLFQSNQDEFSHLRLSSSLLKLDPHQVEFRTARELDGVSSQDNLLGVWPRFRDSVLLV